MKTGLSLSFEKDDQSSNRRYVKCDRNDYTVRLRFLVQWYELKV